jgi:S-adenosylmethionine hydrolase
LSQAGETIAIFDSQDRLELAVVNGSAAVLRQIEQSTAVTVALIPSR